MLKTSIVAICVLLSVSGVRAETIAPWWNTALLPATFDDMENAFEEEGEPITLVHQTQSHAVEASTCHDIADAISRGFSSPDPGQLSRLIACEAMARLLFAAEAEQTTFRLADGRSPIPFAKGWVDVLPAGLSPTRHCGEGLLSLRASDRYWPLSRYVHVYVMGQRDDGRHDTILGQGLMAKVVGPHDLTLEIEGRALSLTRMALADFDGDGQEDMLVLAIEGTNAKLHLLRQFRPGAVIQLTGFKARYVSLLSQCPELMMDMAKTSEGQ